MQEDTIKPTSKFKIDDYSKKIAILQQLCTPGSRIYFFGRQADQRIMLNSEIIYFDPDEWKLYTQPPQLGKQPILIEPGDTLVAQMIGNNGLLRFPVVLQYTHRDQGYVFTVEKRLARIEQRRHRRINIFGKGAILEPTGERRLILENPVPCNLSKSGMRIWVDIGNIHTLHEYKIDIEFTMHKTDPFAPKLRVITMFYLMRIFLAGDGIEVPYHYEAAGYFYEDHRLTERLEKFIERFDSYVPNLEKQKLPTDLNWGKINKLQLKKKTK